MNFFPAGAMAMLQMSFLEFERRLHTNVVIMFPLSFYSSSVLIYLSIICEQCLNEKLPPEQMKKSFLLSMTVVLVINSSSHLGLAKNFCTHIETKLLDQE